MLIRSFVYTLAAWSGYFVMSLELLGGRALSPYFGSGIHVWGAIITLFMLSLSIGYLLGGAWSLYSPTLARLCLLLLVSAFTALPGALYSTPILEAVFDWVSDPRYGALVASVALFFVPITISGAVSPYAIRLLVEALGESGKVAGRVFFISTLGSTLGTLITSFYLVLLFDLDRILSGMLYISTVVALAGLAISKWKTGNATLA
ncbi:MAG: fused MFS/spermidine synthase [Candidatus Accumulibacter sp.]|jgi:hypothetical protein|nr:fused MFS/spermidine synthase [Accumulibacter sp.]